MNCQDRVFPSWNRRGGCASKKKARSLRSGADGVVIRVNVEVETLSGTDPPVCAFIRRLRCIFLKAQPPLLSEEGNTPATVGRSHFRPLGGGFGAGTRKWRATSGKTVSFRVEECLDVRLLGGNGRAILSKATRGRGRTVGTVEIAAQGAQVSG